MANEFKIRKGLIVEGASGGTVVDVLGSQGQLLSVTDDLSGSIFAVSDISGIPIFDVNSSGLSTFDGNVLVGSDSSLLLSNNATVSAYAGTNDSLYLNSKGSGIVRVNFAGGTGGFEVYAGGTSSIFDVSTAGNGTFTGKITSGNDIVNATAGVYTWTGDTDTYIQRSAANEITFKTLALNALVLDASQNATFGGKATSLATAASDGSTTLTTKSYVDGLVTGVPVYKGTWAAGTTGVTSAAINGTTITLTAAPTETIAVGDVVTADGITAAITVTAVASQTSVTVSATVVIAITTTVTFSPEGGYPDLTDATAKVLGNYYIVSTAGSAAPNGTGTEPDSWAVGDWCIFSDVTPGAGTDLWQRIDNSSVISGAGTGGTIPLWEGATNAVSETLTDSPLTVSGTVITAFTNSQNSTGTFITNSEGGGEVGLTVQSRTNRAKLRVADNDSNAYVVAEDGKAFYGAVDSGNINNITVLTDGRVGIGNTGPSQKLHVNGTNHIFKLENTSAVADQYAQMSLKASSATNYIWTQNENSTTYGGANSLNIYTQQAGAIAFFIQGNNEKMRVHTNGFVGIGTDSPASKLSIKDGNLEFLTTAVPTLSSKIIFSESVFGDESFFIEHDGSGAGAANLLKIHGDGSGGTASGITIKRDGLVGIGTDNAQANLDITGTSTDDRGLQIRCGDSSNQTDSAQIILSYAGNSYNSSGYAHSIRTRHNSAVATDNAIDFFLWSPTDTASTLGTKRVMTLEGTGNVGIGTDSPGTFLQLGTYAVAGKYINQATYPDIPSEHMMHITAPSTNAYYGGGISFGETAFTAANIVVRDAGGSGALDLCFGTGTAAGVTEKMRITNAGELQVTGNGVIKNEHSSANYSYWQQTGSDARLFTQYAQPLYFGTNASTRMTILSGGNVGIGVTGPSYQLEVNNTTNENIARFYRSSSATSISQLVSTGRPQTRYSYDGQQAWYVGNNIGTFGIGTGYLASTVPSFNITSSGNVGIGTTAPNNLLNLQRNVAGGDVAAYIQNFNGDVGSTDETASVKFAHGNDGVVGYVGGKLVCGKEGDFETSIANIKGNLQFYTASGTSLDSDVNNIERMRIDSAGNVGIGTTTPLAKLDIQGTQGQLFSVTDDLSGSIFAVADISGVPIFDVNSSGVSYFDGKVGIGTASPSTELQVESTNPIITLQRNNNGNAGGAVQFRGSDSVVDWQIGTNQVVGLGFEFNFQNSNKVYIDTGGSIGIGTTSPVNTAWGGSTNTAQLSLEGSNYGVINLQGSYTALTKYSIGVGGSKFYMAYDNVASKHRMVMNSNSYLALSNDAGSGPTYPLDVYHNSTSGVIIRAKGIGAMILIESNTAGEAYLYQKPNQTGDQEARFMMTANSTYGWAWSDDGSGTPASRVKYMKLDQNPGTLTVKGDVVAYGTPSDISLKENIKPIDSALDKVMKLQGVTFDWKKTDSILELKEDIGFIAQDVQKVVPELIRENSNGLLSMRHQGVAPILLEAIKELKAEIDLLKSKPCTCNKCNCNV